MKRHRFTAAAVLAAALPAGSAFALPFAGTPTAGSPDSLLLFDTDDLSVTTPGPALGGDFVRGLDLSANLTGYYIVTGGFSFDPSTFGLYELNNGVSTFVSNLGGIDDTSVGGLSLSADGSFLYFVGDLVDNDGGDEIYTISLTGSISAPTVITNSLDEPDFAGLAVAPDGTVYGLANDTDSLYTIDPGTGVATLVGETGFSFFGVSGLDFGPDGQLYAALGDDIATLDLATGTATVLGDVGPSLSNLAYNPPIPEPSTLALAGVGALAALRRRR
ncbi:MAG: PEP-CTERM sorting domain-containing protein [Planctomycetota bacterium]